jgi:hypothetical protein
MAQVFVLLNPRPIAAEAAHFGVPAEHYLSSTPDIGMQAIEIAHSGLVIANPKIYGQSRDLTPAQLFLGVYDETPSNNVRNEDGSAAITAYIPEQVEELCKGRNIPTIAAARVGMKVLRYAFANEAGLSADLGVYADRSPRKKGKLESTLSFSISPINMILMHRKRTLRSKIKKPFVR